MPRRQEGQFPGTAEELERAIEKYLRVRREVMRGRVTAGEFAASLGRSVSYLQRVFRRVLGQTVLEALRTRQLAHAEELLRHTAIPIHDIAQRAGFGTGTSFYRVFIKYRGMTPEQYRQESTA
jgi:AraC-like DNA-binding protein